MNSLSPLYRLPSRQNSTHLGTSSVPTMNMLKTEVCPPLGDEVCRANLLACPCEVKSPMQDVPEGGLVCSSAQCPHSKSVARFPSFRGVPVLIAFSRCDTLANPDSYLSDNESSNQHYVNRKRPPLTALLRKIVHGGNEVTAANCRTFIDTLKMRSARPRILVIGSGTRGNGTEELWADESLSRIGIDIYPSESTDYIADAHYLPFGTGVFDGVWIQAVLEHVAEPARVVAEIERVLCAGGLVYSETPFMQQVHEGPYDFQRYTVTGHRFLFRRFSTIAMGGLKGPGTVLAWGLRTFLWGLVRNRYLAVALSMPFAFLLRLLDSVMDPRVYWDGPSSAYFLGRKSDQALPQSELPALYRGLQR
jgi:SAM-dependent methyltransferase